MDFKKELANLVKKHIKQDVTNLIEIPPDFNLGDYALPCFTLAKTLKKNPNEIALDLSEKISSNFLERIEAKGPYLNFFIKKEFLARETLTIILKQKDKYGSSNIGKRKTIIVEMSSPNIAKPFSIGHLRSTIIGESLNRILKFSGYKTIRINHLGDWGTQFGNLIYAYKNWGSPKKLKKSPILHLLELYTRFHDEVSKNPDLEEQGRKEFKKLEDKDKENTKLWKLFTKLSLMEFNKIYKLLGVKFEHLTGESFYQEKLNQTLVLLKNKKLVKESEGALIIELEKDIPPAMLLKSDGASTYCLRDITAALYRLNKFNPEYVIYVVGQEQILHFKQVFSTIELFNKKKQKLIHIPFGHYHLEGSKMATRKGKIIFMEDVLDQAISKSLEIIKQKNPKLKNKEKTSQVVGIGSIIFGDLLNDRVKDIEFNWSKILDFEGATAPYLQYTYARASSILRKSKYKKPDFSQLQTDIEKQLIVKLMNFPNIVESALKEYKPHIISQYLIDLAQKFNEFYHSCPVLKASVNIKNARLALVNCTKQVIKNGLNLLNINVIEEM